MIYFDYASTGTIDEDIYSQSFMLAKKYWANPSAKHALGKEAYNFLNDLRSRSAKVLGVADKQIIFNSGATEGNQFIFLNQLNNLASNSEILINKSEHPAIYENILTLKKFNHTIKELTNNDLGQVTTDILEKNITVKTKLVCIMWVNNETGAINNIKELASFCRDFSKKNNSRHIHFHVDATQALGKVSLADFKNLSIDSAVFSGHKVGAPRGSGLLYIHEPKASFLKGGGQEFGLRSGTENLMSSIAMTLALEKHVLFNHDYNTINFIIENLVAMGATINPKNRINNSNQFVNSIVNFSFKDIPGEVLQRALSKNGLMCSTGSACKSNSNDFHSRVLDAMGVSKKDAFNAVRFSFSPKLSLAEASEAIDILKTTLAKLNH